MALPNGLIEAAKNGHLVPLVGAGVSLSVSGPGGARLFPSWWGLLQGFVTELKAEGRNQAALVEAFLAQTPANMMEAAKYARAGYGADWFRALQRVFDPPEFDPTSLALPRAIWRLSDLCITTNYDRVLQWASPKPHATRTVGINAPQLAGFLRGVDRPTVWHLHGHVDQPEEIILTPDGYATLYPDGAVQAAHEAALLTLRAVLAARTLLFVGFSLEDDAFVKQLEWVRDTFQGAGGPHYVVVRAAEADAMVRKLHGLDVRPVTFEQFGAPLVALVEAIADAAGAAPSTPPTVTAPPVTPVTPEVATPVTPKPTPVTPPPERPSLNTIVRRALDAGLVARDRRSGLLSGLPAGFCAGLPSLSAPIDQLRSDVQRLAQARLASVASPLAHWLRNASELLAFEDHPDAAEFAAWAEVFERP
jgi:hypothetical protein